MLSSVWLETWSKIWWSNLSRNSWQFLQNLRIDRCLIRVSLEIRGFRSRFYSKATSSWSLIWRKMWQFFRQNMARQQMPSPKCSSWQAKRPLLKILALHQCTKIRQPPQNKPSQPKMKSALTRELNRAVELNQDRKKLILGLKFKRLATCFCVRQKFRKKRLVRWKQVVHDQNYSNGSTWSAYSGSPRFRQKQTKWNTKMWLNKLMRWPSAKNLQSWSILWEYRLQPNSQAVFWPKYLPLANLLSSLCSIGTESSKTDFWSYKR